MAASLERAARRPGERRDPGDALIGLLGFVALVKAFPPTDPRAARFPPLARVMRATRERHAP